jgi:hypothetical protein
MTTETATPIKNPITKEIENSQNPTIWFKELLIPLFKREFDTAAEVFDENCEWIMMPNMQSMKGRKACIDLCSQGLKASDKTPEIMLNVSTPEWGVFEYINRGIITKDLEVLAKNDPDFQLTDDVNALIGKEYHVAVCFIDLPGA